MESYNGGDIFQGQTQIVAKTKTKVGKPPTRLQKKAPSSLQVNYGNNAYPFVPSSTPIPLLSPLIVSPPPLLSQLETEEFKFPVIGGGCGGDVDRADGCDDKKIAGLVFPEAGWQHPAVANGYKEPSSLFNIFQSKCVLVNHAK